MKRLRLFGNVDGEPVLSPAGVILCILIYPVYIYLLPRAVQSFLARYFLSNNPEASMTEIYNYLHTRVIWLNLVVYCAVAVILLIFFGKYLFESAKHFFRNFRFRNMYVFVVGFAIIYIGNVAAALITSSATGQTQSANNEAAVGLISQNTSVMLIMTVLLSPFCEEMIFRAALYRPVYYKNKFIAALLTMLLFGLHHVWQAALAGDTSQLVYIIQYIPSTVAIIYAYCVYNNIFGAMLMHAFSNAFSVFVIYLSDRMKEML